MAQKVSRKNNYIIVNDNGTYHTGSVFTVNVIGYGITDKGNEVSQHITDK